MVTSETRWSAWHTSYDQPDSALRRRLTVVQDAIRQALPPRVIDGYKIISICAGQGRDVIEVLADRPDAAHIATRLVELDPQLVADARRRAAEVGLGSVEVWEDDAARLSAYQGIAPADLVLACGVFGNISDDDIFETISRLPQLCTKGATVIWTRHRRDPDLTTPIRDTFQDLGFVEVDFVAPQDAFFSVGVMRYVEEPVPLDPDITMFTFLS